MEPTWIIFAVIILFTISLFLIRMWIVDSSKKSGNSEELMGWLRDVSSRIESQSAATDQKPSNATAVISQVQKNIGEFAEIGRGMRELQEFLSSPKIRGNIGEQILKELLKQYFPKDTYKLQYAFKSGEKVDAVIVTSQGLIPIDSKFPLENFKKYAKATDAKERSD